MLFSRASKIRVSQLMRRLQSTAVGRAASRPEMLQLEAKLADVMKDKKDLGRVMAALRETVQGVVESGGLSDRTLLRSNSVTNDLGKLLEQSNKQLRGEIETDTVPPTPYEILVTLVDLKLARRTHYEQVMQYLLANGDAEAALGVWVKYLEFVAQMPQREGAEETYVMAYASIAYFFLGAADVDVLLQLLNREAGQYKDIPLFRIEQLQSQIGLSESNLTKVRENLAAIHKQLLVDKKGYFLDVILPECYYPLLHSYYKRYSDLEGLVDEDLAAGFMINFSRIGKHTLAMKCYNDAVKKAGGKPGVVLKNALLTVVARMGETAINRVNATRRIEAVWNSYFREDDVIDVSSYKALLNALIILKRFDKVQSVWELDIPEELKKDHTLLQTYLEGCAHRTNVSLPELLKQLPEAVTDVNLANAVLLKMANTSGSASMFDSFYDKTFKGPGSLRPTPLTLATRLLMGYATASDPAKFNFFDHTPIPRTMKNAVAEEFLKICSDSEAIKRFYESSKASLKLDVFSSRRVGKIIEASFNIGDWKTAEAIFKDHITTSNAKSQINVHTLLPLIAGFSNLILRNNEPSFLSKLDTYWQLASRVYKTIPFEFLNKTATAVASLCLKEAKLTDEHYNFINAVVMSELARSKKDHGYVLNARIYHSITKDQKISVPPELL
ncbi:ADR383Cp [Eremothecium gossypii ATCC 10895]|uniref:Meiotic sister-chromatid recombination protein 6, mitochondrial n=1 Tax=Eremothecium gossypii (strain ATCC 10895 / CBS 109.51 / FGSC 9923 / NRRL Y-1056) TaxID=284811 RepID=MSC6_EREGS|nr:ADR383Cp [Eremothecium gossypii ATCC 10895]Q758Z4.2 RecName: Full=Meiotic sister-chromatid recombination protein 6, mitochondrial; Flags: Precursor [Eremothecium gossypii ATCC 10895]AAS52303.2 ADR383Cp [Eremothecium gossypii ATCC 10895]AEY96600.1 FADR383Cp [Eremothecium gossypii FDAG1]